MRYFFFSAAFYNSDGAFAIDNFTCNCPDFPKKDELVSGIQKVKHGATSISLLSICEMSKDDYDRFMSN